jgi:hypothetical protein
MEYSILDSLRQLLNQQSMANHAAGFCPFCGNPLTYLDTTFWLYGRDESWAIRLPVCELCISRNAGEKVVAMNSEVSKSVSKGWDAKEWRHAYNAALSEADTSKLNDRIGDAEMAVVLRARQLFQDQGKDKDTDTNGDPDKNKSDHAEETLALDEAMNALRLLRGVPGRNKRLTIVQNGDRFAA